MGTDIRPLLVTIRMVWGGAGGKIWPKIENLAFFRVLLSYPQQIKPPKPKYFVTLSSGRPQSFTLGTIQEYESSKEQSRGQKMGQNGVKFTYNVFKLL